MCIRDSAESFLNIIDSIRSRCPEAGFRSNFITGFPGETDADVAVLADFLQRARLDVAGIFAYSDEEGTEAAGLDGHVDEDVITARREDLADLTDELVSQRAEDRIGTRGRVMVEEIDEAVIGRAEHQGPEVDGCVTLVDAAAVSVGDIVDVEFVGSDGVDLVALPANV